MTDTDHQPHTTTDDLTDWLANQLAAGMGVPWKHLDEPSRDPWRTRARALLTSGPLADRLNAADRDAAARRETIRSVREQAWSDGYDACYRGQQRHNPYRGDR